MNYGFILYRPTKKKGAKYAHKIEVHGNLVYQGMFDKEKPQKYVEDTRAIINNHKFSLK